MSVFSELRRRNVFRTAIAYGMAAFALIEAADLLAPIFNAPAWIPQVVAYSFVLGFPVVVVLAWFYEITPEGIKPAGEAQALEPAGFLGRKIDFAIIGLLVLALGFVVVDNYVLTAPERDRSIAVLPFENLSASDDEDAEFFATGMHDALLTQLAKLGDMRVISRTSVLEYANTTKNLREIGQELGVATIMEGRVQRAGDALNINVQLIDARTDEHLWGEIYDRELTAEGIFAVQREMATSIAAALQATLSPVEVEQIERIPTQNEQAYRYYLGALRYEQSPGNHDLRVRQYENAVREDPKFALAWAALTDAAIDWARWLEDPAEVDRLRERAREAAATAYDLAPDLAESHLARGIILGRLDGDDEAALGEYTIAEQLMPGSAWVHFQRASLLRRLGRYDEAIAAYARSQELDPRDSSLFTQQGRVYAVLRDYERAEEAFDRALAIYPEDPGANPSRFLIHEAQGDLDGMTVSLEAEESSLRRPRYDRRWKIAFFERDFESALLSLENSASDEAEKAGDYGKTWKFLSDTPGLATRYFEISRRGLADYLAELDDDPEYPDYSEYLEVATFLAETLGYLRRRDEALAYAGQVRAALPERIPEFQPIQELHLKLIWAYIAAGDYATAIADLDHYLNSPAMWSIEGIMLDPRLDPIRDDPNFLALVEKYASDP